MGYGRVEVEIKKEKKKRGIFLVQNNN